MAYMSQDKKKELAPLIKKVCKKHGVKATLGVRHHSTLVLNIKSGDVDFIGDSEDEFINGYQVQKDEYYTQINQYHYKNHYEDNPKALAFLNELIPSMMTGNHDNSDIMIDYFDVGWYIDIKVGAWNKPYILTGE